MTDKTQRRKAIVKKSIDVILNNQEDNGSYPASPTFPQFHYCWLRDGMFTAEAALEIGHAKEAKKFYQWVNRTLIKHKSIVEGLELKLKNKEKLTSADFLPARFTMTGDLEEPNTDGKPFFFYKWPKVYALEGLGKDGDWPNFQTDCYGAWLWGVANYIKTTDDKAFLIECQSSIDLTIKYLKLTWTMPCFDPWEEYGTKRNIASLGSIAGGLQAINEFYEDEKISGLIEAIKQTILDSAVENGGVFPKYIGASHIDGNSLWLTIPYKVFPIDHPYVVATIKRLEKELLVNGGVKRYYNDVYYGGGEWIVLTCWLGLYYLEADEPKKATALLEWVESHTEKGYAFPEQSLEALNYPEFKDDWQNKWWGESPAPLLWSHAMYLIFLKKYEAAIHE
ncbi:glycoside hydrolase family 15 protein [Levilactobacillus brevis]|uniref:glycoside hydrolase family 15 protein n=1 Tax=Levilactobacillus brevis TaxID=1580 RepID=UPI001BDE179E|nr:glycoside hydrolase family 15 protein [Levilactobacillus brevis]